MVKSVVVPVLCSLSKLWDVRQLVVGQHAFRSSLIGPLFLFLDWQIKVICWTVSGITAKNAIKQPWRMIYHYLRLFNLWPFSHKNWLLGCCFEIILWMSEVHVNQSSRHRSWMDQCHALIICRRLHHCCILTESRSIFKMLCRKYFSACCCPVAFHLNNIRSYIIILNILKHIFWGICYFRLLRLILKHIRYILSLKFSLIKCLKVLRPPLGI